MATWDYEGYWNTVLGANRSAADVVNEFDLVGGNRESLSEWLGTAEAEAWLAGRHEGTLGEAWEGFHGRALDELCEAARRAASYYVIGHGRSEIAAIREADSDPRGFPGELVQRLTSLAEEYDDCWAVVVAADESDLDHDPAVLTYARVRDEAP